MTTDQEAAWQAALARYRDGYGGAPDFADATDQYLFVTLLEEEVHKRITRSLVTMFQRATERLEAQTRALETRP